MLVLQFQQINGGRSMSKKKQAEIIVTDGKNAVTFEKVQEAVTFLWGKSAKQWQVYVRVPMDSQYMDDVKQKIEAVLTAVR